MAAGTIRLDPGSTKNDDGRVVYLAPELTELLTAQVERVQTLSRELERVVPWLFRTSRVHETRAIFDRYHIVSPADPAGPARKLAACLSRSPGHSGAGDTAPAEAE